MIYIKGIITYSERWCDNICLIICQYKLLLYCKKIKLLIIMYGANLLLSFTLYVYVYVSYSIGGSLF